MPIISQTSRVEYQGNESTSTPYPITFRYDDPAWVLVEVIDEDNVVNELALGADYTLTGEGSDIEGNVVTGGGAIPDTSTLRISRNTALTQSNSIVPNGAIPTSTIVASFDKLTMCLIDLARRVVDGMARALRVPNGETLDELPSAADRAGKIPYFNATTGALELLTPTELLALADTATFAIGTVTHLPEGQTPTASITGNWPDFTLNLGLPTGATGGLDIGADATFGTTPNNQGGPAFTLYDFGTASFQAIWLHNGVFSAGVFPGP
jgi:hypothetical protein